MQHHFAAKLPYLADAALTAGFGVLAMVAPMPDVVMQGLGFTISPAVLLSSLCFAVAGAYAAMAISPPHKRSDKWTTLVVGVVVGVIALAMKPHIPLVSEWPVIAVSGLAGLTSLPLARKLVNFEWPFPGFGKGEPK